MKFHFTASDWVLGSSFLVWPWKALTKLSQKEKASFCSQGRIRKCTVTSAFFSSFLYQVLRLEASHRKAQIHPAVSWPLWLTDVRGERELRSSNWITLFIGIVSWAVYLSLLMAWYELGVWSRSSKCLKTQQVLPESLEFSEICIRVKNQNWFKNLRLWNSLSLLCIYLWARHQTKQQTVVCRNDVYIYLSLQKLRTATHLIVFFFFKLLSRDNKTRFLVIMR